MKNNLAAVCLIGTMLAFTSCGKNDTESVEATTVTTTSASLKIEVKEIKEEPAEMTTAITTNETSESTAVMTTAKISEQPEEFDSNAAAELVIKGIEYLRKGDYAKMLETTNFGDICRITDDMSEGSKAKILSDDEIYRDILIYNNKAKYKDVLDTWNEIRELTGETSVNLQNVTGVRDLQQNEIDNIIYTVKQLTSNPGVLPEYTEGKEIAVMYNGSPAGMYVVKDKEGKWRYDLCLVNVGKKFASMMNP